MFSQAKKKKIYILQNKYILYYKKKPLQRRLKNPIKTTCCLQKTFIYIKTNQYAFKKCCCT